MIACEHDSMLWSSLSTLIQTLFPVHASRRQVARLTPSDITSFLNPKMHDDVYVLTNYRHPDVRALLWQAKYYQYTHAFKLLGNMLGNTLERAYPHHEVKEKILIPIPLSKKRLRERGYNQVTRILEAALPHCRNTNICADLLVRTAHTTPQTKLPRAERLKNLHGIFAVRTHTVSKDTHIFLIDDVMTTGTTLHEAKHALEKAGYINITCVALAH